MKNFALITFCLLHFTSCNQDDDFSSANVPSIVLSTFQTNFSNAKDLDWEIAGQNYEADFEIDNIDYSALINEKGELLKHKHDNEFFNLSQALQDTLIHKYTRNNIDDVETLVVNKDTYYQIEIEQSIIDLEKVYDKNGNESETISFWD